MNNRLNEYLSEVETRLRPLPRVDREQEVAEIGQHLDALITAGMSEGKNEDNAAADAITQFGTAREFCKRLFLTKRRKQAALLVETVLFTAAASPMVLLLNQSLWRVWQAVLPKDAVHVVIMPPPALNWEIGFAAVAIVVFRYGLRGAARKTFGASPTGALVRWLLLLTIGDVFSSSLTCNLPVLCGGSMSDIPPLAHTLTYVFTFVFPLLNTGLAAYVTGRCSRARESVADIVGIGAAWGQTAFYFFFAARYMLLWLQNNTSALSEAVLKSGLVLMLALVYVVVLVWVARFFVQRGEKSRFLPHHAKQIA